MNNFTRVMKARMAGLTCAAIALPMVSLAVQAGPPLHDVMGDGSTVAAKNDHSDVARMAVRYDDLDLVSPKGIATLKARIKHAVEHLCGNADSHQMEDIAAVNQCERAARADAMAQVAMVAQVARARTVAAR